MTNVKNKGAKTAPKAIKPQDKAVNKTASTNPKLSLEDKMGVLKKMNATLKKRDILLSSIMKLDSFSTEDTTLNTRLVISDGEYRTENEFKTANTFVIEAVLDLIKDKIFEEIEKTELLISELQIS